MSAADTLTNNLGMRWWDSELGWLEMNEKDELMEKFWKKKIVGFRKTKLITKEEREVKKTTF